MNQKVVELDYHRNGISGLGFYVGIVDEKEDDEQRKMLVVRFPDCDDKAGATVCAAFDIAKLSRFDPDIKFGSNSWRGDLYADVMDKAIAKMGR